MAPTFYRRAVLGMERLPALTLKRLPPPVARAFARHCEHNAAPKQPAPMDTGLPYRWSL